MSKCDHGKWMWFGDGRRYCADCGDKMSGPPMTEADAKQLVAQYQRRCERCPPGEGCNASDIIDRSAPPQPGDAERLAIIDGRIANGPLNVSGEKDILFLRRLLDAAQSALADLEQAYIVIQEQRDELQSTLAESQQIAKMRRNDWLAVTAERDSMQSTFAESYTEADNLAHNLVQLQDEYNITRAELAESQERAETLEADAANDAAEIISLRSALAESREATKVWAEEQKRWAEKLAERTSELTESREADAVHILGERKS